LCFYSSCSSSPNKLPLNPTGNADFLIASLGGGRASVASAAVTDLEEDLFWSLVPVGIKTLHYEAAKDNLHKRHVAAFPAGTNTYVPDLCSCGQDGLKSCLLCTVHRTSVILLEKGCSKGKENEISAFLFFTCCIVFIYLLFIIFSHSTKNG